MALSDRDLARQLGWILDSTGRLEGQVLAVRDLVMREFGPDYFSDEFNKGFALSIREIREHVHHCYNAIDQGGGVELPQRDNEEGDS